MATYNTLQDRIRVAKELLERVDKICSRQGREVEGRAKLCSKLRAEIKFLQKVEAGKVVIKESHLQSTNLNSSEGHRRISRESRECGERPARVHLWGPWRPETDFSGRCGGERRTHLGESHRTQGRGAA